METVDYLKTIKTMRSIVLFTISISVVASLCFAALYIKATSNNEKNVYVATDAGTFLAKRNDYGMRYDFEIKNHVRLFFQDILEGDQNTYTKNVENGLNLIDNPNGKKIYELLQTGGFYELYKRENAHTKVVVDSIKVRMDKRPYSAKIWLQQNVYWAGYSKPIPYCAIMELVEDNRSEKNPFGLLITNFSFVEYKIAAPITMPNDTLN
jgi:hypothetical protein